MSKKLLNQFISSRMMLPEHQERLDSHRKSIQEKESFKKLLLDESQLQEFENLLKKSLYFGLEITITHVTKNSQKVSTGVVKNIDTISRKVHLFKEGKNEIIDAKNIIKITKKSG